MVLGILRKKRLADNVGIPPIVLRGGSQYITSFPIQLSSRIFNTYRNKRIRDRQAQLSGRMGNAFRYRSETKNAFRIRTK
jgi:hypothetical protein